MARKQVLKDMGGSAGILSRKIITLIWVKMYLKCKSFFLQLESEKVA